MNVRCPRCETIYRVDPAKVPQGGVRARCAVCSGIIPVTREAEAARPAAAPVSPQSPAAAATPPPVRPSIGGRPPISRTPSPAAAPPRVQPQAPRDTPQPPRPHPPARPSAPVFRPAQAAPVSPASTPPARPAGPTAPSAPAAAPGAPARASAGGHVNPFLAQDPRQKARRLARALVSDMIVYQPEKRQKALREGNLKEAFAEEIKKSWEEYVLQVGEELANSTTYFTDALNEILAGGQKIF